jgi:hypothetical protein
MNRYKCHKLVDAAKIIGITDESRTILTDDGLSYGPEIASRYKPVPGDYVVKYDDGYLSVSPKAAFDAGYTLVER